MTLSLCTQFQIGGIIYDRVCDSMIYAARHDLPRIIEYCFAAPIISMKIKARVIWKYADENGSTRVLTWPLGYWRIDLILWNLLFLTCVVQQLIL